MNPLPPITSHPNLHNVAWDIFDGRGRDHGWAAHVFGVGTYLAALAKEGHPELAAQLRAEYDSRRSTAPVTVVRDADASRCPGYHGDFPPVE